MNSQQVPARFPIFSVVNFWLSDYIDWLDFADFSACREPR